MKFRVNARRISIGVATGASLVVASVMLAGCTAGGMVSDADRQGSSGGVGFHGMSLPLSIEQLIGRAALVVVGKPTRVEVAAFRDAVSANELPANEREDPIYLNGSFNRYAVEVERVVKFEGDAPGPKIDVRTYADTPGVAIEGSGRPKIEIGQRYLFVLFRGDGVWQNSWLILGENGLAPLEGNTAVFPSGERHSLDRLAR
ncbi:MAG: hypothetical protein ACRDQF_03530 [Thermocrispum sp.]